MALDSEVNISLHTYRIHTGARRMEGRLYIQPLRGVSPDGHTLSVSTTGRKKQTFIASSVSLVSVQLTARMMLSLMNPG